MRDYYPLARDTQSFERNTTLLARKGVRKGMRENQKGVIPRVQAAKGRKAETQSDREREREEKKAQTTKIVFLCNVALC